MCRTTGGVEVERKRTGGKEGKVEADLSRRSLVRSFSCFLFDFRSATGVLASDAKGRDVKLDGYSLSFHGRVLIESAEVVLK